MPKSTIPQAVIDKDHDLESRTDRAGEALAKHRWHQTLDPKGPQHSIAGYARAIGRNRQSVTAMINGYATFIEQPAAQRSRSLGDMIALERTKVEDRVFAEAIAEGSGETVQRVAGSGRRAQLAGDIATAKDRAERRGTDPVDEARDIAERRRKTREMEGRHRAQAKQRRTLRYVEIEGDLASAQRRLLHALSIAEGVGFDDEEMELLRDSIVKVRAVLDLIDLRMAGTPDIDWDAEAAKLMAGGAS